MTGDGRFRVAFPVGGAPPADDVRMVLLNAALVVEDAKKVVAAAGMRPQDDEEVRDVMGHRVRDALAAMAADPSSMGVMMEE